MVKYTCVRSEVLGYTFKNNRGVACVDAYLHATLYLCECALCTVKSLY